VTARPKMVDLFCKAGGTSMGYHRAGFDVVGVDIKRQRHYPFDFIQADALTFDVSGFQAVHASPPCQDHSDLAGIARSHRPGGADHGTGWMLAATVAKLQESGLPWVCENVVGRDVVMSGWWFELCGSSFGLGVRRHRRFGSSALMLAPGCRHDLQPRPMDVTGGGGPSYTERTDGKGGRSAKGSLAEASVAMGIDWMSRRELSQAVPPAYTEWIGANLLAEVMAA
jgi:DNA (cytosine-5)-methyltransferase 1